MNTSSLGDEDAVFQQASEMIAQKHTELRAKGFEENLVNAAISRAQGMVRHKISPLREEIQPAAMIDYLRDELAHTERWITNTTAFLDSGVEGLTKSV